MTTARTALSIKLVHPVEHNHHFIEWEVNTEQLGTGPFTFSLYRAGSEQGPWTLLDAMLVDVFTYEDTTDLLHGMNKDLFYKVETTIGGDIFGSGPRGIYPNISRKKALIIRKIVKDEFKLLTRGNGLQVYVVKKKHWGERCKFCYDTKTGQVVKSKCTNCFGTSFEVGYHKPIYTWAHLKPTTLGTDLAAYTSTPEVDTASGFLQAFPSVIRGDFIVEPEVNRRWEITAVQPTEILRNTVHQDLTLSRLPNAHPVYQVAVP
jgi:hypothetical protein